MSDLAWTVMLLFLLLHIAGMIGTNLHSQPLGKIRSHEVFVQTDLKPQSSQSLPPK
jgi:hypothetical protein